MIEEIIQVSGYGYIVISVLANVFDKRLRYYSLKYIEGGAEMLNVKFDIRTLSSILTSLFSIQSYIQGDEVFVEDIVIYPNCRDSINISRHRGTDYVTVSYNNLGFKIDNGYIGRVFSNIEDIFLDNIIINNDYFL